MADLYVGVDVGASRTKVALLDSFGTLQGKAVHKSGTDFGATAEKCLDEALTMAGEVSKSIKRCVSTGYGRNNVSFSDDTKTEIACHARGCYHYYARAMTVIDIGGQDNKVIRLDEQGRRLGFKMNRKCAAGTGAFLEEMAMRLDVPLQDFDALARLAQSTVELGSYCTVFSATEVLEKIRQGKKIEDLVRGIFLSVVKRVLEMDLLSDTIAMTGGVVAHNPYLVEMVRDITSKEVLVPPFPQFTGAVGAALFAAENERKGA